MALDHVLLEIMLANPTLTVEEAKREAAASTAQRIHSAKLSPAPLFPDEFSARLTDRRIEHAFSKATQ